MLHLFWFKLTKKCIYMAVFIVCLYLYALKTEYLNKMVQVLAEMWTKSKVTCFAIASQIPSSPSTCIEITELLSTFHHHHIHGAAFNLIWIKTQSMRGVVQATNAADITVSFLLDSAGHHQSVLLARGVSGGDKTPSGLKCEFPAACCATQIW